MSKKFQISLVAEASDSVGYGHAIRTGILATSLREKGHKVNHYVLGSKLNNKIFRNTKFIDNSKKVSQKTECIILDFYNNLKKSDINHFKKQTKKIISFQDSKSNNKFKFNGLINFKKKDYNSKSNVKFFYGLKYLILGENFTSKKFKKKDYIFLCFGGSDPLNQIPKYLNWIKLSKIKKKVYVAIIKDSKKLSKFKKDNQVKIFINSRKLEKLMGESKFAICSGGNILAELLALNKNCLCISLSRNQRKFVKLFSNNSNLNYLGDYKNISRKNFLHKFNILEKKVFSLNSKPINKFGVENLSNDLTNWLIDQDQKNKIKVFSKDDIIKDYEKSFHKKPLYKKLHWGSVASMKSRHNFLEQIINFKKVSSWLDIGSGDGSLQKLILNKFNSINCLGVEISKKLHSLSKHRKLKNFKSINDDFINLSLKNKFNLVTCHGVLSKTNFSLKDFLKKSNLMIKKNGYLVFDITNLHWKKFENSNFFKEPAHNWFNPYEVKKLINNLKNFKIIKILGLKSSKNKKIKIKDTHSVFYILKKI